MLAADQGCLVLAADPGCLVLAEDQGCLVLAQGCWDLGADQSCLRLVLAANCPSILILMQPSAESVVWQRWLRAARAVRPPQACQAD